MTITPKTDLPGGFSAEPNKLHSWLDIFSSDGIWVGWLRTQAVAAWAGAGQNPRQPSTGIDKLLNDYDNASQQRRRSEVVPDAEHHARTLIRTAFATLQAGRDAARKEGDQILAQAKDLEGRYIVEARSAAEARIRAEVAEAKLRAWEEAAGHSWPWAHQTCR